MGFLDVFKGKKPDLNITVDPAEALPGDEVVVRVTIAGELDDKVRGGVVGIRCLNDYLTKEWDRQDDEWDEVWRAVSLHEDQSDLPLEAGEHEFRFTLPTGLPPDSREAVSWWAFANIDREKALDAKATMRIAVRLPSAGTPQDRRAIPAGEDGVAFDDLPASVGAGQTLAGRLSVTPPDDVKTTGVKVKLTRVCDYRDDRHQITRSKDVAEVEVAPGQELVGGQTQQFDFLLAVPANPGPTAQAPHTTVEWIVTGFVARRMRPDLTVKAPIVVFDGP